MFAPGRRPYGLPALASLAAFAVVAALHLSGRGVFEPFALHATDLVALEPWHTLVDRIAPLGSLEVPTPITLLLVVLLRRRGHRRAALAPAIGMLALLAVEAAFRLLPGSVQWDRAVDAARDPWSAGVVRDGFPSGHTGRIALVALMATALLPRPLRGTGVVAGVPLALVMAVQRVHAGAHTGADVVGGILLGWCVGALVLAALAPAPVGDRAVVKATGAPRAPGPAPAPDSGT